ncbi:MAG TPA: serine/threonine-protein kinase [Phycisphaerae bacterium]|nr:serine/threonine-protein kinase [Phycisphaerae bacterium]HNU46899.1 serine/threonine-protein kinase [Phycisphaerae bacterium]
MPDVQGGSASGDPSQGSKQFWEGSLPPRLSRHWAGERVGAYELIERIDNDSGMGEVWRAERADQKFKRVAAIKFIKPGMDTRRLLEQFQRERQILADLKNENITVLHDAGTTEDGSPYLVMEYVTGLPIDEYCEQHRLSTRERLRLIEKLCRAVGSAHQALVAHCDLKPNNILVTRDGVPKLLDFGIAKVLKAEEAAGDSTITLAQLRLFTPSYASPEQVRSAPITTATDIYSLGVVICKVLTGKHPYDVDSNASLEAVVNTILHVGPARPSALKKGMDRDVDFIVLKCLRKEPRERYSSAAALADDISRHLAGEPIDTGNGWYVLRRTLHRYRVPLAVAAAVVLLLTAALITSLRAWQAADWQRYVATLGASSRALELYRAAEASELLDHVPQRFRQNWEWQYLVAHLDESAATLCGHTDAVLDVAFSPDGALLYSVSNDQTVGCWDIGSRRQMWSHQGHEDCVNCIAIDGAGCTIATGSADQDVRLWDARTGELLRTFENALGGSIVSLAFSSDGTKLVAGTATGDAPEGTIGIIDLSSGEVVSIPTGDYTINAIAFLPDGTTFLTGGEDGIVRRWDVSSGEELQSQEVPCWGITDIAVSPDGSRFFLGAKDHTIWTGDTKLESGVRRFARHDRSVTSLALSPDGSWLVSGSEDHAVRVSDTSTDNALRTYVGHEAAVRGVAFSADGAWLASCSADGTVKLWDAARSTRNSVLTVRSGDRDKDKYVHALAFSSDGALLVTGCRDGKLGLWNAVSGEPLCAPLVEQGGILAVVLLPDEQKLLFATGGSQEEENGVYVWDISAGWDASTDHVHKLSRITPNNRLVSRAAFSRDGRLVAITGHDETLAEIWDVRTGALAARLLGHAGPIHCLAFDQSGTLIATGSDDKTARLWDATTGSLLHTLHGHGGVVRQVTFSPDGGRIATASFDHTVRIWATASGRELQTLRGHSDVVLSVAFSPDGTRVVSGCQDHTIKVWDVTTGNDLLTLRGHDEAVHSLCFNSNGTLLASGARDGIVRLWRREKPTDSPDGRTSR